MTYETKFVFQVKNVSKNGSSEKDNSLQLAKTLCIIFIVFATCWTPYTTLAVSEWKTNLFWKGKTRFNESLLGLRFIHQKCTTGISVVHKKDMCPPNIFFKKLCDSFQVEVLGERPDRRPCNFGSQVDLY